MKVVYTVDDCYNESAGPSYSVPGMCHALKLNGADVHLHTSGDLPPTRTFEFPAFGHKRDFLPWPNMFPSKEMRDALRADCTDAQIVHINTVWRFPSIYGFRAAKASGAKVVIAPRGALSATARKRSSWKKWLARRVGGEEMLRKCDMFHVTSPKERDEVRELGLTQPIMFVPIGIDVPAVDGIAKGGENGRKIIAFFGRVHVTKAVDHLVQAWGEVAARFPDWEVQIAGPDCGAVPGLKKLIAERKIPRVTFVGELHGQAKYAFLAKADLYCLPSLTENFGITIAEALVCGTPAIASYGSPWPGLETHGCGWWLPIGPDPLAEQLYETLAMPVSDLRAMGARGKEWMARDYTWKGVGRQLLEGYQWIIDPTQEKPAFIY